MIAFGTYHAKTHFTDLLARVESGEEITITRHGRPVAKLVPVVDTDRKGDGDDIIEAFRRIRQAVTKRGGMKGASVRELIREGRRL